MDRTSILGDAIDYMKELLQNINKLQEEMNLGESELGLFKNSPEDILIRNSPKVTTYFLKYLAYIQLTRQTKRDGESNNRNDILSYMQFEVERREKSSASASASASETRIEISCCGEGKGLLVSTVTTLEALGMDIHHCVISCFNDFAFQASCSQVLSLSLSLPLIN